MNYLVIEGYKDAAEKFAEETGMEPTVELESIEDRMNIRNSVQAGEIDQAIEQVNDLDPEVLSNALEVSRTRPDTDSLRDRSWT